MDIFESKLIFNHVYGSAEKNINIEKIDEIENNNSNNSNSNNNINNDKNQNNEEIQENININNIDNNITYNEKETENKKGYVFREVVNKGIYDYINKIRFCNSSKNLTSVENISEEIDLDDINDEDLDENDNNNNKNKKNEKFTITNFDELDDEESSNSIGEIFKQTSEMIKKIKFRNKMNENKNSFNKKILNNIVIEDLKQKKNKEDLNNSEIIKKKSKTMNKFNSKSKSYVSLGIENRNNSLPIIIGNNDNENFNSEKSKKLKENKNIFEFNKTNKDNNIKVLPNIKIKIREPKQGRYFYDHEININKKIPNSNMNERINNFRSNNIIKIKENKENSFYSSLKRSSENSSNFKFCISLFNKDHKHLNKDNNKDNNKDINKDNNK